MYRKRLSAWFLALCLAAGMTGCGLLPEGKDTASQPAQDAQTDLTPAPEPEPEPTPEELRHEAAVHYVNGLSTEQQAAQMFFARCPERGAAELAGQYDIGGYILFGRDFDGKTKAEVTDAIASCQAAAATPMLIGVDEEGGTVVRVSSNPKLAPSKFFSPQTLLDQNGLEGLVYDAQDKDALLRGLGINVNLAPVCDVAAPGSFIYPRTFGEDAAGTAGCVRAVVYQMRDDRMGMVLKHFPGYGSNMDTHTGIAIDERSLDSFRQTDFLPFEAGIEAGAQAVLVNHNIVTCMDADRPASLSPAVHQVLRDELGFNGVVMTDDLIMDAIRQYTGGEDAAVLAVQAGNDMLISSDFVTQYNAVLAALNDGRITSGQIRAAAVRVIEWKMALGLMPEG